MTIRTIAITVAIILTATISNSQAKLNEFCEAKYCGHVEQATTVKQAKYHSVRKHYKHHRKSLKIKAQAFKKKKAVQVASIGKEPLGEAPRDNGLLAKAKSYLGGNPTGWRSLWCARFIAMIAPSAAEALKRMGLNPNWARDYAKLPRTDDPKPGDLVVLTRGDGGHIGVLKGFDKRGNPIIISGNHGNKVGEGTYSKSRVIAYATAI